jgi:hypothetical protein
VPEPLVFTEADWNSEAIADVERQGKDASPMIKYRAAKTLAERAAWDLYRAHQAEGKWDLVTVIPTNVSHQKKNSHV